MIDETPSPATDEAERAPEPDIDAEIERRAAEESSMAAPKHRTGGLHADLLPGEVGPCTRCGWVWTPSNATLSRVPSGLPRRCANCRSDYWMLTPVMQHARRPGDPEWSRRRDTIANRKKRRKLAKLKALAKEFRMDVLNGPADPPSASRLLHSPARAQEPAPVIPAAVDLTPRMPWQKPRTVIPPPPGMEEEKR